MTREELKFRTRQFAFDAVDLCLALGSGDLARLVRPQLLRAGTGVASNYRAACRGRSFREFVSKLGVAVEESDESEFWLDLLNAKAHRPVDVVATLLEESRAIRAILGASYGTSRRRLDDERGRRRSSGTQP